jgi:hypothetical protein
VEIELKTKPLTLTEGEEVERDAKQDEKRAEGFHPDRVNDRGGDHRDFSSAGYSQVYASHYQVQAV